MDETASVVTPAEARKSATAILVVSLASPLFPLTMATDVWFLAWIPAAIALTMWTRVPVREPKGRLEVAVSLTPRRSLSDAHLRKDLRVGGWSSWLVLIRWAYFAACAVTMFLITR